MAIPVWQRFLGLLVYLLPWSDAIPFGSHLMLQFPWLQWLTLPALPLVLLERGIPFGNLLVFFLLFLAVVRNPNVPYFLRFNTLQALLVDIIVVILGYAFAILIQPLGGGLMLRTLSSTVVVAVGGADLRLDRMHPWPGARSARLESGRTDAALLRLSTPRR